MNKILMIGRLTKEPLMKYTSEGKSLISGHLAVQRPYKNKEGKYDADFIPCVFWNRMAETVGNYCQKGSLIGVTGRLTVRNYQNERDERVYVTEVVADGISLLEKKKENEASLDITEIFHEEE